MKTTKRIIARILSLVMIFTTVSNTYLQARASELPAADGAEVRIAEQQETEVTEGTGEEFVVSEPSETQPVEGDFAETTEPAYTEPDVAATTGEGDNTPTGLDPGSEIVTEDGTNVQTDGTEEIPADAQPADDGTEQVNEGSTEKVDNGVIIFYVSGQGGSVSNEKDTFYPEQGANALTGSVAIADSGYIFKNWTADDGTVLSESEEFMPDAKEIEYLTSLYNAANESGQAAEVTYTANYVEAASEFEKEIPNVIRVKIYVAEGAFDREVELAVDQLAQNSNEYRDAEAALADAEKTYESMMAFDIRFEDVETGEEIEPAGPVKMDINVLQRAITDTINETEGVEEITSGAEIEIHHIVETETQKVVETIADNTQPENPDTATVETATDRNDNVTEIEAKDVELGSFSIFVITTGGQKTTQSATVGAKVYKPYTGNGKDFSTLEGTKWAVWGEPAAVKDMTFTVESDDTVQLAGNSRGKELSYKFDDPAYDRNFVAVYRKNGDNWDKITGFYALEGGGNKGMWIAGVTESGSVHNFLNASWAEVRDATDEYYFLVKESEGDGVYAKANRYERLSAEENGWRRSNKADGAVYFDNDPDTMLGAQPSSVFTRFTVGAANFGARQELTAEFTKNPAGTGAFHRLLDEQDNEVEFEAVYYRDGKAGVDYDAEYVKVERFTMENNGDVTATIKRNGQNTKITYLSADGQTDNSEDFAWLYADPAKWSEGGLTGYQQDIIRVKLYLRYDNHLPAGTEFVNQQDNFHANVSGGKYLPGLGGNVPYFYPVPLEIDLGQVLANGGKVFSHQQYGIAQSGGKPEQVYYSYVAGGSKWGTFTGNNDNDIEGARKFFNEVIFPAIQGAGQDAILNAFGYQMAGDKKIPNYVGYVLKWEEHASGGHGGTGDSYWHLDGAPYAYPMWTVLLYEGKANGNNKERFFINNGNDFSFSSLEGPDDYALARERFNKHFRDVKFPGKTIDIDWTDNYNGVITELATGKQHEFKITPDAKNKEALTESKSGILNDADPQNGKWGTITYELRNPEPAAFHVAIFNVQITEKDTGALEIIKKLEGDSKGQLFGKELIFRLYEVNNETRKLYFKSTGTNTYRFMTEASAAGDTTVTDHIKLTMPAADSATIRIDGMEPGKEYRVEEDRGFTAALEAKGYTVKIDGLPAANRGDDYGKHARSEAIKKDEIVSVSITNTITGKTEVPVEKKWEDNNDALGFRPNSVNVKVKLKANNEEVVAEYELKASEDWKHTFTDLPLVDAQGNPIDYTVEEDPVPGYVSTKVETKDGWVITNRLDDPSALQGGKKGDVSPDKSKYVTYRNDGTYDLTLTMQGVKGDKYKVDVLFVVDTSSSMRYRMDSEQVGNPSRIAKLKEVYDNLITNLNSNAKIDAKYSLVTFDGYYYDNGPDAKVRQDWTDNAGTAKRALQTSLVANNDYYATNYTAGLQETIKQLGKARDGAQTIVVFLSDGAPTLYTSATGRRGGTGDYYGNNVPTCLWYAVNQAGKITGVNQFYTVAIGKSSTNTALNTHQNLISVANAVTSADYKENFDASDADKLAASFRTIENNIVSVPISNAEIHDTLNSRVEFVTGKDGTEKTELRLEVQNAAGTTIAKSNAAADAKTASVTFTDQGKVVTATLTRNGSDVTVKFTTSDNTPYRLNPTYKFLATMRIEPTANAYTDYQVNGYPATGDEGTGTTSAGKKGYFSNQTGSAYIEYSYKDDPGFREDYDKPVVQLFTKDVKVTKKWNDGNAENRPNVIIGAFDDMGNLAGTTEISGSGNLTGTITGLRKWKGGEEVHYTVKELKIGVALKDAKPEDWIASGQNGSYTVQITGTETGGFTVSNTLTGTTEVTVNKVWKGDAGSATFTLKWANGAKVQRDADDQPIENPVTLSGDKTTHTWGNLRLYDRTTGALNSFIVDESVVDGYKQLGGTQNGNVWTFTNIQLIDIPVEKKWEGTPYADGAKFVLVINGRDSDQTITIRGNGKDSFKNLPLFDDNGSPIVYDVKEEPIEGYDTTKEGSVEEGFTFINTEYISISVNKVWDDKDDQDGVRPDEIRFGLFRNDETTPIRDVTVQKPQAATGNRWEFANLFENLPQKANGQAITYTVKEWSSAQKAWITSGAYNADYTESSRTGNAANGFTFTNKHTPEKKDIFVKKVWKDNNNFDKKRPADVKVQLFKGTTPVGEKVTLNEENKWEYKWEGQPVKENGQPVTYSVVEDPILDANNVPLYQTSYAEADGAQGKIFTVTNTYDTEKIRVKVTKIWTDNNDQDGIRPDTLSVKLTATLDGQPYALNIPDATVVLGTDDAVAGNNNAWEYTWNNLDSNVDGKPIVYSVDEVSVPKGYEKIGPTGAGTYAFTIENKHDPEKIPVKVTKKWADESNIENIRPTSVKLGLFKSTGTSPLKEETVTGTGDTWSHEFTGLDRYEDGKEIVYIVKEWSDTRKAWITDGAYNAAYTASAEGLEITNTHTPEPTEVTVTKKWADDDNRDNVRPTSVTVGLFADGAAEPSYTHTLTGGMTDESWTYTFTNLKKYRDGKQGEEIVYTVKEQNGANWIDSGKFGENYTLTTVGNELTNSHEIITTTVRVTKAWKDKENQDGVRPETLDVYLTANGVKVDGSDVSLTAAKNWSHEWTGLPMNEAGTRISYDVVETLPANSGYSESKHEITKLENETVIAIENEYAPEQTSVKVTKVWKDNNDQDGFRPVSITVQLSADGIVKDTQILNEGNNWTYTWIGLDLKKDGNNIVYTVDETEVPAQYTKVVTGDAATGFVITNTHTPVPTEVTVTKVWDDNDNQGGKRPVSIRVQLLANNSPKGDPVVLTAANATDDVNGNDAWTYTWTGLDRYAGGKEISYDVQELDVTSPYTKVKTGTQATGYVITNTYLPIPTQISVEKVWDDEDNQDGKRPADIDVTLIRVNVGETEETEIETVKLNAGNGWKKTWNILPSFVAGKEVAYKVVEDESKLPEGYTLTGNVYDASEKKVTLTNSYTPETVDVKVIKNWEDDNDHDKKRPAIDEFRVTLQKNGQAAETVVLSEDSANSWSYTWEKLPKYENGRLINYNVVEASDMGEYKVERTSRILDKDGNVTTAEAAIRSYEFTLKNTYTPGKTSFTVTKRWADGDNQDGIRPQEIQLTLTGKADGKDVTLDEAVAKVTVKPDNQGNWTYTWTELDLIDSASGKEITYDVIEEVVPQGYEVSYKEENGVKIVLNTHKPEETEFEATKIWDDENNQDGVRPASVRVQLLSDGVPTGDPVVLNEANKWTHKWTKLAKNKDGKEITYSFKEYAAVYNPNTKNWTSSSTMVGSGATDAASFDEELYLETTYSEDRKSVTNKHVPEVINIPVVKVWKDALYTDLRPESITLVLSRKDGKNLPAGVNAEYTLSGTKEDDEWSYTWENLPKYENGVIIEYQIDEKVVPTGYEKVVTGDMTQYIITNTYLKKPVDVPVIKVWADSNDYDGKRPTTITVGLFKEPATGGERKLVESYPLTKDDKDVDGKEWSHYFRNLDQRDTNGVIKYIVGELKEGGNARRVEDYIFDNGAYNADYATTVDQDARVITNTHDSKIDKAVKLATDPTFKPEITLENNGDVFDYQFKTAIPDRATLKTFVIRDELKDLLKFASTEAEIKASITPAEAGALADVKIEGQNLEISWKFAEGQDPDWTYINQDIKGKAIEITFKAQLVSTTPDMTKDYVQKANGRIPNSVRYQIDQEPEKESDDVHVKPKTEKINIPVEKIWADSDNYDNVRPTVIKVAVFKGTERIATKEITADSKEYNDKAWTVLFEELDAAEANGDPITYTVKELKQGAAENDAANWLDRGAFNGQYNVEVTGDQNNGYTVTNTHDSKIDKAVKKANGTWEGRVELENNSDDFEYKFETAIPDRATLKTFVIRDTLRDLLKFANDDATDVVIEPADVAALANPVINGRDLEITWKFAEGQDPDITYINQEIKGKAVTITVKAKIADPENLDLSKDYLVDGSIPNTVRYQIDQEPEKNSDDVYVTPKTDYKSIKVKKTWDDDDNRDQVRPSYIKFVLLADEQDGNGERAIETAFLTVDDATDLNTWEHVFGLNGKGEPTLPVLSTSGKTILYTVQEVVMTNADYTSEIDENDKYHVVNKYQPKTVEITVEKEWDDDEDRDRIRPENVEFTLKAYQTVSNKEVEIDLKDAKGNTVEATVTLNEDNGWKAEWTNLPAMRDKLPVRYDVTEEEFENYTAYTVMKNDPKPETSADGKTTTYAYKFKNVHEPTPTRVEFEKIWTDGNDQDSYRPDSITVTLKASVKGAEYDLTTDTAVVKHNIVLTKIVTAADGWKTNWDQLNAKSEGEIIDYTVEEVALSNNDDRYTVGEAKAERNASTGVWEVKVENVHEPEKVDVSVHKTWDDEGNQDGKQPADVTVYLKKNGETIDTQVLNKDNEWSYVWTGLDRKSHGEVIKYDVVEEPVAEYRLTKVLTETKESGDAIEITADTATKHYELTNSYIPGVTEVVVIKNWDDANNQDGIRPEEIRMQLYADGKEVGTYNILGTDGKPLKDANGENITDNGLATLTGDEWSYEWKSLPLKKAGKEIVYTVKEVDTEGNALEDGTAYTVEVTEGTRKGTYEYKVSYQDTNNVWSVKNSYEPKKINIPVEKIWSDAEDYDGSRPTSISVKLVEIRVDENGVTKEKQIGDTEVLSKSLNDWKYEWMGLDKYFDGGKTIGYRVEEIGYTLKNENGEDVYFDGIPEGYAVRYGWKEVSEDGTVIDYEKGAVLDNAHNPKPKKEVDASEAILNAEKTKAELKARDQVFTFRIKAAAPELIRSESVNPDGSKKVGELTKFVITDTLNDDLVFAGSKDDVKVNIKGGVAEINEQTLTVTFEGSKVIEAIKGKEVVVEFDAKFAENADVSKYLTAGKSGIPNEATVTFAGPDNNPASEPTNEVTVTPPDPPIKKEVSTPNGGETNTEKDHAILAARDEEFTYTLKTTIPEREMTEYEILDEVVPELGIVPGTLQVTIGGTPVDTEKSVLPIAKVEGNTVRVRFEGETAKAELARLAGQEVIVTFNAMIVNDRNISKYFEEGQTGVPNKAKYTYKFPGGEGYEDSNEVTVEPPEPPVEKEVNGVKTYELQNSREAVTYTIATQIPEKQIVSFAITDTLVDVLEFVSEEKDVRVKEYTLDAQGNRIAGKNVGADVKIDKQALTLTVTIAEEYLKVSKGKPVMVEFEAKIRDNATAAQLAKYLVTPADGVNAIPNKAAYTYKVPNDPKEYEKTTPPVYIIPADPEIKKNVVNEKGESHKDLKLHADLVGRYGTHPYTITTSIPKKANVESFTIHDELEAVLEYVSKEGEVEVKVGGKPAATSDAKVSIQGKTMDVVFDGDYVNKHLGEEVVVTFNARIVDGADLISPEDYTRAYTVYPEAPHTGHVRVPNQASYLIAYNEAAVLADIAKRQEQSSGRGQALAHPPTEPGFAADESQENRLTKVYSNYVTVTPPDDKVTKEINDAAGTNADKIHLDLTNWDEVYGYTINARIPEKADLKTVTVEDTLEDALNFEPAGNGNVRVTAGAQTLAEGTDYTKQISGKKLTVSFTSSYLANNRGKQISVSFNAKVAEGADLTKYPKSAVGDLPMIPNTAGFKYVFGNNPEVTDESDPVTVTPKPEFIDLPVEKRWDDEDDRDGVRPETITVRVFDDNGVQVASETLTAANNWKHTFKDLPKFVNSKVGVPVKYTVEEDGVAQYGAPRITTAENGEVTITNPYTPGKTRVTVIKRWNDTDNATGMRPSSVTIRLVADGTPTGATLTLNSTNGWRGAFEDLDLNSAKGQAIRYTVTEDAVSGYTSAITPVDGMSGEVAYAYLVENSADNGTLTVVKRVNGEVGGNVAYTFIITDSTGAEVNRITITGDGSQTITVPVGTYTVTEVGANNSTIARYTMMTAGNGQRVRVIAGAEATATIVNTYTPERETPPPTTTERPPAPPITTDPVPARTPQQALPPIEAGQVLGVRRTDSENVLGARRGKTGDRSHEGRLLTMMMSGAAALLAMVAGRRRKKQED